MLNEQVVADFIERVGIESGDERFGQPFVEFNVEDGEAQRLRGPDFSSVAREPGRIDGSAVGQQTGRFKQSLHGNAFQCGWKTSRHRLVPGGKRT